MNNKYKIIEKGIRLSCLVSCALHLSMSTALCGHFDLDDIDRVTHKRHYNALPSVEENDVLLKSSPHFDSFLKEAEEIITRYELESAVGLRLIHRHFILSDNQVMAEGYEVVDTIPSLVTYAHTFEEAKEKGAVPGSWIFSDNVQDEVLPFETSNDSAVKANHSKLQQSPGFFDEIGESLKRHTLNNLLSVAVLKRDSLIAEKGQKYMEINASNEDRSIVQLWDEKNDSINAIRTSWSFKGPRQQDCLRLWDCRWLDDQHRRVVVDHVAGY